MTAKKNQHYYFIFVHEDGTGLERISEFFADKRIEASVDQIFKLNGVKKQSSSENSRWKVKREDYF